MMFIVTRLKVSFQFNLTESFRYHLFLEVKSTSVVVDADAIDARLCASNRGYAYQRASNQLACMVLHIVKAGTFAKCFDLLRARGQPNQVKIPRLVRDSALIAMLRSNDREI